MQFVPPIQCQFCGGSHKEWESVQACGEARARQLKPDPKDARISALTAENERLKKLATEAVELLAVVKSYLPTMSTGRTIAWEFLIRPDVKAMRGRG